MISFKTLKDQKMNEKGFADLYQKECHICAGTLKIIEAMEADLKLKAEVLKKTGMGEKTYQAFLDGEYCDPASARKLYACLGLSQDAEVFKNCPRMKK